MRTPEVRERLKELAREHNIPELTLLSEALKRRTPVRRAATESRPLTDRLRVEIADYARSHPDYSLRVIGERFNVNAGRVSEVLAGKR